MKVKRGFTLVEISLFIALSAALFLVIVIGVQNSIFQQRYNDSVQDFEEFLRTVYSGVTNVQNDVSGGTSKKAIYGKLVTFGESTNLSGEANDDRTIFVYNVVGNIDKNIGTGSALELLKNLDANVLVKKEDNNVAYAGMVDNYNMRWSSSVQNVKDTDNFVGALLVVRHPKSGALETYIMAGKTVEVNNEKKNNALNDVPDVLDGYLVTDGTGFVKETIDFCVNPYSDKDMNHRADVRIDKGAKTSAAINTFYDSDDNNCRK